MATKIQLRRDLSANWQGTNPVLAQGEPGVELDTHKMKVGDGVKAWNDLGYVSSAAGDPEATQNLFVKLMGMDGSSYNGQGAVSVSYDGLNWTLGSNQLGTWYNGWYLEGIAVGGGRVVYVTYEDSIALDEDRYGLRWALNPFDKPNVPQGTGSDLTRHGPDNQEVYWNNVRYVGGKFVAVGYYYDVNDPYYALPYVIHSEDGDSWTKINIDYSFIADKVAAERVTSNGSSIGGMQFRDVAYANGAWLINALWDGNDTSTTRALAGAFYVTDLTATLNSSNYVTNLSGSYIAEWNGSAWAAYANYDDAVGGPATYFNTNQDPRMGSWTTVDMRKVVRGLVGTDYWTDCFTDMASGEVNGESWTVFGTQSYGAIATKDNGVTWRLIQTEGRSFQIRHITDTSPARIDDWSSWTSGYQGIQHNGMKVNIQGSTIPQMNGTFYAEYYDTQHIPTQGGNRDVFNLYSDYDPETETFSSPLDATSWGDVTFSGAEVNIDAKNGDHTLYLTGGDTTGLRVGMAAEGWTTDLSTLDYDTKGGTEPNTIVALDPVKNTITMKYPYHGPDNDGVNAYFYPLLTMAYGDGIGSLAYGDGAFIGFAYQDSHRGYRTADMTTWQHTTRARSAIGAGGWDNNIGSINNGGAQYYNPAYTEIAYGAVTTPESLLINSSETVPGVASYLNVGDTFTMSVISGDPEWSNTYLAEGTFNNAYIYMDPSEGYWYMGMYSYGEGTGIHSYISYPEGYVGTDSLAVQTNNHSFYFDNSIGQFRTDNLYVGNGNSNLYISTDAHTSNGGSIHINSPYNGYIGDTSDLGYDSGSHNQEGYAAMTYDDDVNFVKVDYYGVTIQSKSDWNSYNRARWNYTNDCNGDGWATLYQPRHALIQSEGYWKLGDYFDDADWYGDPSVFIQAYDYADPGPGDLHISADGSGWVFTRYNELRSWEAGAIIQVYGNWLIGNYYGEGFDNPYTFIEGTDTHSGTMGYHATLHVSADGADWYFQPDGNLRLPSSGDIIDSDGISVLNKDMPQTLQNTGYDYTIQLTDRGRHIYVVSAGDIYIPTHASVAFPIGTCITVVTDGTHSTHIKAVDSGTTTLVLSKTGPANTVTGIAVGADTYVTMLKVENNRWMIQEA